jgi:protein-disulfide isomerase
MAARRSRRSERAARGGGRRPRVRTSWVIAAMAAGLAAGGVAIIVSVVARPGDEEGPGGADQTPVATGHPCASGSVPVDGATCGHDSAPVTIVEYSEFLCPFCARAALNTLPEVEEEYVAAGKVKLEFKHFIVHGQRAVLAAGAAECASEQDAFWEYQHLLFANQDALDVPDLRGYAEEVGVDIGEFNTCLDSERYLDKLEADVDEGRQRGVSGTPSFLIDGKLVVGYQPFEEFRVHIEEALAER